MAYERAAWKASLNPVSGATWRAAEEEAARLLEESPAEIERGVALITNELEGAERERWQLSIQVAATRNPGAGSKRLFEESVTLMDSGIPLEELRREAPAKRVRPAKVTAAPKAFADSFDYSRQRLVDDEAEKARADGGRLRSRCRGRAGFARPASVDREVRMGGEIFATHIGPIDAPGRVPDHALATSGRSPGPRGRGRSSSKGPTALAARRFRHKRGTRCLPPRAQPRADGRPATSATLALCSLRRLVSRLSLLFDSMPTCSSRCPGDVPDRPATAGNLLAERRPPERRPLLPQKGIEFLGRVLFVSR